MSSHESIAAQFWLWPDPVMKRDAQGRILFINAAFLQLYGGTVEAWTGNVLQGWPAPQPTEPGSYPVPYRFETRMPSQEPNQPEEVYDWIEQNAPDGSAFALARNVTSFVSVAAPQPQNTTSETPPYQDTQSQHTHAQEGPPPVQSAADQTPQQDTYTDPTQAPQSDPAPAEAATAPQDSVYSPEASQTSSIDYGSETAGNESPQTETASTATAQPSPSQHQDFQDAVEMASDEDDSFTAPQAEAPQAETNTPDAALQSRPDANDLEQAQTQASDSGDPQTAPPEERNEERDFERRALPLDENSAVLGNNWRDAVIAKALGVEDSPAPEAAAPTEETTPASKAPPLENGVKRILLAEDNAINALLTRTLLEAENHVVDTVEDGALAVEAMNNQSYDLIFMDMRMPNMDGLEATRKIRALAHVTKELPIIALTANAFDDDRNACFDSGMNDFMTKPVSAEELTQMVQTWTGQGEEKSAA